MTIFDIGWMKFTPASYDLQAPYGHAYAEHVYYDHKIPQFRDMLKRSEFAWDYCVVLLDRDFGDVGYWNFKVYNPEWNGKPFWRHVGYGGK